MILRRETRPGPDLRWNMTLLEQWREEAYEQQQTDSRRMTEFWGRYFEAEKSVYEKLLAEPETEVRGTVKELAEKYEMPLTWMMGFLDGINDSLKEANPIETAAEDTEVSLAFDPEKLYYNMVAAKADWLYELPAWEDILTEERRKELYHQQKNSMTVRREKKIFPNDPCPCGSGKKYKHCCGRKK